MRFAAIVLGLMVVTSAQAKSVDVLVLRENYYSCLVGETAAAMFYRAASLDKAFAKSMVDCRPGEAALRRAPRDGEPDEADEVQSARDEALDTLRRF